MALCAAAFDMAEHLWWYAEVHTFAKTVGRWAASFQNIFEKSNHRQRYVHRFRCFHCGTGPIETDYYASKYHHCDLSFHFKNLSNSEFW